jgi:HSP20 family protein
MRHLIEDMFGDVDRGRPLGPRDAGQWEGGLLWSPRIDMAEKNGRLEIRADLPGMTKSDVRIETRDDVIILEGERRSEQEESKGGVYRTERTYGKFRRVIPLPEGTNTDQATATFRNGVLEITMKAPDRNASRGKRLEIQEGTAGAAEPQTRH